MLLSELLTVDAIKTRVDAIAKREAVAELVSLLESAHRLDSRGEILDRVLARETMMSTGIGNGVAIPHGKARAVERMIAACAVSPAGVDFDAADGEPAHLFILLVSPESVGPSHVKVLANISRLLKEESVRKSLREAGTAGAFLAALKAAESRYLTPTPS